MLETEIKNNTAALTALAAAVAELTAALSVIAVSPRVARTGNLSEIPNSCPAVPAPVTPAGGMDTNVPSSVPVAPAAPVAPVVPAPAPVAAPAPVPAAAAPVISGDDLRKLCVKAGAAGLTAEVVQFLSDHGVTKLAALPPADYPALVALLNSKGVQ